MTLQQCEDEHDDTVESDYHADNRNGDICIVFEALYPVHIDRKPHSEAFDHAQYDIFDTGIVDAAP